MKKDGVRLASIGTPQQDEVGVLNLLIGTGPAPCSENRRQTGDAWGMSSSITTINVVAADHRPHELLRHIIQFVGCFRAAEHAKRLGTALCDLAADAAGDQVQSFFPGRFAVLPVLAHQRIR